MKISEAITILNIKNYTIHNIHNISYNELKKYYHIQCLIYHPDKNNTDVNATLTFQTINCAYNVLRELLLNNGDTNSDTNGDTNSDTSGDYNNLLLTFLNFIVKYYASNENITQDINNFKINANIHIKALLTTLFDNFSITILEDLYFYLLKYIKVKTYDANDANETIYNAIIEIIKTILEEKLSNHSIYILSPNLLNLFNSDIYKLQINDEIIYIPLWHNELKFENNIIKIEPLLDTNIIIDSDNNIHYTYTNSFNNIIDLLNTNNSSLTINIENHSFNILIGDLTFNKYQIYTIKNQGLSKINTYNILDNSYKSDIIFHIYLV